MNKITEETSELVPYEINSVIKVSDCLHLKEYRLYNNINSIIKSIEIQEDIQNKLKLNYNQIKVESRKILLKTLVSALDKYTLNGKNEKKYQMVYKCFKKLGKTKEEHLAKLFENYFPYKNRSILKMNKLNRKYFRKIIENFHIRKLNERKNELKFRLNCEILDKYKKGYYMFFNTLTVQNEHINKVFYSKDNVFGNYIKKIKYDIAKDNNLIEKDDILTHFAVVEKGDETGRLHIHVILFMKHLIKGIVDPNYGREIPVEREIGTFKRYWKYGSSSNIAVRLHNNDSFGKIGWLFPCEKSGQKYKTIEIKGVGALSNYITKYVEKRLTQRKGMKLWKTRMTRNLGMKQLKMMISQMDTTLMKSLIKMKVPIKKMMMGQQIPPFLLRKEIIKSYLKKKKKLNMTEIPNFLMELKSRENVMKNLEIMTPQTMKYNPQNSTNSEIQILSEKEDFDLDRIIKSIDNKYYIKDILNCINGNTRGIQC